MTKYQKERIYDSYYDDDAVWYEFNKSWMKSHEGDAEVIIIDYLIDKGIISEDDDDDSFDITKWINENYQDAIRIVSEENELNDSALGDFAEYVNDLVESGYEDYLESKRSE